MKKLFLLFALFGSVTSNSQVNQKLNKDFNQDDSSALVTVASYPDSLRTNILLACQKPNFLVQTEALQKNTSQSFRDLMDNYSKDEQAKFWNLTRYPALINEISTGEKKSKEELEIIASHYPKEIRSLAVEYGHKHYKVLTDINNITKNSNSEFEKIISDYPEQTKNSFRTLINHPDVINTLSSNMHLSVILGNMYSSDPETTLQMLSSVKADHDTQSAKEAEDWKNGLEKDPDAKKEMEDASKEFIKDKDPDYAVDDVYSDPSVSGTNPQVYTNTPNVNYPVQPYPYWFGYPSWYGYPYWYPYPYWYNTGFYFGPGGGIVYMGLPSPFFMHWYFFHPNHHYYYSHFSNYCVGYNYAHYGPRFQRSGFNNEIHQWTRANEANLPKGYFNNDANRQSRIKELGKFEMDYHNNTTGIFGKNISRPEFLKNNSQYYQHLSPAINQPHFNQPIRYPAQQNPVRFNMGSSPVRSQVRSGGNFQIRSGGVRGGGGRR